MLFLETVHEPGIEPRSSLSSVSILRSDHDSVASMLAALQTAYDTMNPDIVLTEGGDQRWFPWLVEQGRLHGQPLVLGRTSDALERSTHQRTVHSYGQTRHRHGAFFLNGRLHIDLKNSFIVSEGGFPACLNWHSTLVNRLRSFRGFHRVRSSAPFKCGSPWTTVSSFRGRKIALKTQSPLLICFRLTGVGCTSTADQAFMHR